MYGYTHDDDIFNIFALSWVIPSGWMILDLCVTNVHV